MAGLKPQDVNGKFEAEIAYLVKRDFWRMGLATEAAIASRDYGIQVLERSRLISLIRPENIPSIGVALKVGMTFEERIVWRDLPCDVYSLSR